jgi:hypothetical protein
MRSTVPTRLKATTPDERAYPHHEKRQDGQHPGCEVAVGGERGEAGGQIGTYDTRKEEDEPEEAVAVQSSDRTLCFEPGHRFELGARCTRPKQSSHAT